MLKSIDMYQDILDKTILKNCVYSCAIHTVCSFSELKSVTLIPILTAGTFQCYNVSVTVVVVFPPTLPDFVCVTVTVDKSS